MNCFISVLNIDFSFADFFFFVSNHFSFTKTIGSILESITDLSGEESNVAINSCFFISVKLLHFFDLKGYVDLKQKITRYSLLSPFFSSNSKNFVHYFFFSENNLNLAMKYSFTNPPDSLKLLSSAIFELKHSLVTTKNRQIQASDLPSKPLQANLVDIVKSIKLTNFKFDFFGDYTSKSLIDILTQSLNQQLLDTLFVLLHICFTKLLPHKETVEKNAAATTNPISEQTLQPPPILPIL